MVTYLSKEWNQVNINYQIKIDTNIRDSASYPLYKEPVLEIIRSCPNSILRFPALLV